jgi:hypothetical protein
MLRFHIVQGKRNERGNFEFKLTDAHEVTVKAGQGNPLGQEIAQIDQSVIGKGVTVERTTKGSCNNTRDSI